MTTKTDTIHTAFVKAQRLIGGARKSSNNPHFKSKYANLEEVMNACSDILNDHGIHITQPTMYEAGADLFVVRTILTHTSGETIQDFGVPVLGWKGQQNEAQKFIAGETYARRGGLSSLVGIAPEDDDGNSLTQDKPAAKTAAKPVEMVTTEQAEDLNFIADDLSVDKVKFCKWLGVGSIAQIPASQFQKAMDALEKKRDAA